jgi:hypothetical protein
VGSGIVTVVQKRARPPCEEMVIQRMSHELTPDAARGTARNMRQKKTEGDNGEGITMRKEQKEMRGKLVSLRKPRDTRHAAETRALKELGVA